MSQDIDHHPQPAPDSAAAFDFERQELHLPAWVKGKWPMRFQAAVYSVAFLASWLIGLAATDSAVESYAVVMLIYVASVVVHELGHWAGALATGRPVIAAQLSWLALFRQRRGWRVRLSRPRHAAGWVMAVTPDGKASRSAAAVFIAGGVLANAMLVAAGMAGVAWLGMVEGWVWFAVAAVNAAMMLASLTPQAAHNFTDGLHLIAIARGKRSAKIGDLLEHMVARAIAGRVQIPPVELDALSQAAGGVALLARYFAICNHLRNGADERARVEGAAAVAAYDALDPAEKAGIAPTMDMIRFELAMMDADAATVRSIKIHKDFEFRAPYLPLRRQAFLEALQGDREAVKRALARHEAMSENSLDAGARASESKWRERLSGLLDECTARCGATSRISPDPAADRVSG